MLTAGEMAPDFEGLTATGERLKLSSMKGRSVVLYFYPKASTSGCRRESLEFARLYPEAKRRQIDIIGVSVDNVHDQRKFADECQLPFPLIADHEKIIAREYGVLGAFGLAKRVTFMLDPDGRIAEVITGMLPEPHVHALSQRVESEPPTEPAHSISK
jgi:peroxiredoxin Q/BCP